LFIALWFVFACSASGEGPELDSSSLVGLTELDGRSAEFTSRAAIDSGSVQYVFSWRELSSEWTQYNRIKNDLGYVLEFESALIGINRVQLVPCKTASSTRFWQDLSIVSLAYAGHDDGPPDPSAFSAGLVEEIGGGGVRETPVVELETGTYCGVHVLYAETPEFADGAEDEMVGLTVLLRGTWRPEWNDTKLDFELKTTLGNGVMHLFEEEGVEPINLATDGVEIGVERSLLGLFNGMDFEVMNNKALSKVFLTNLVANTTIRTTRSPSE